MLRLTADGVCSAAVREHQSSQCKCSHGAAARQTADGSGHSGSQAVTGPLGTHWALARLASLVQWSPAPDSPCRQAAAPLSLGAAASLRLLSSCNFLWRFTTACLILRWNWFQLGFLSSLGNEVSCTEYSGLTGEPGSKHVAFLRSESRV